MGYVAARTIKVQNAKGEIEIRHAGDPVPETAQFANPEPWVRRGYIRPDDDEPRREAYDRGKLRPMRAATPADAERAVSHVPVPKEPLPELQDSPPATAAGDTAAGDATGAAGVADDAKERLMSMTREEMESFASENTDLDATSRRKYPTKESLADAIIEAAGG